MEQERALAQYANHRPPGQNAPGQGALINDQGQQQEAEFRDVALSESEGNNMQFRPKAKGIKSGKGDAEQKKGFFANLFGCCSSKKSGPQKPKDKAM